MRLAKRLTAAAAVLALVATGCGTADDSNDPQSPWTLRIAVASEIPNLDAQYTNGQWTSLLHYNNVSESLTAKDPNGQIVPKLATEWELIDPTTWRFTLRENVTFHNGEPFDAEAAAFSLNRIISGESQSTHAGFFTEMAAAEAQDPTTLIVTTKTPAPELPAKLIFAPMVPPALARSAPDALSKNLVGTGPYIVDSVSTEQVTLHKNPDYWGGPVGGPDNVIMASRPETSARLAALQAKEFDIVTDVPTNLLNLAPKIITSSIGRKAMLILNAYRPVFSDPKVREAFVLAIDSEGIRNAVFPGDASTPGGCQFATEGTFGYTENLPDQEYDPARARRLLEEANAVGTKIAVVGSTHYAGAPATMQLVVEQAKAAGFDVEYQEMDYNSFLRHVVSDRATRYDVLMIQNTHDSGTVSQPMRTYLLESAPTSSFPQQEYPDIQQKVSAATSEIDPDKRSAAYDELNREVCESNAFVFLYGVKIAYGVQENISFPGRKDSQMPFTEITRS